jgi:hypothetical protein
LRQKKDALVKYGRQRNQNGIEEIRRQSVEELRCGRRMAFHFGTDAEGGALPRGTLRKSGKQRAYEKKSEKE